MLTLTGGRVKWLVELVGRGSRKGSRRPVGESVSSRPKPTSSHLSHTRSTANASRNRLYSNASHIRYALRAPQHPHHRRLVGRRPTCPGAREEAAALAPDRPGRCSGETGASADPTPPSSFRARDLTHVPYAGLLVLPDRRPTRERRPRLVRLLITYNQSRAGD
jgi:hypothetical protein